jgi:hypothetical protein
VECVHSDDPSIQVHVVDWDGVDAEDKDSYPAWPTIVDEHGQLNIDCSKVPHQVW